MAVKAIILLGAPGAGKGTIAEDIRSSTAYAHVSTGDMLRAAIKAGNAVGKEAEAYMTKGELVPDRVIVEIVMQRIDRGGSDGLYMFDGFPRTLEQARLLDVEFKKRNAELERVFLLDVPREVAIQRLAGRRVCSKCGASFHVQNIPPKKSGICDYCGGELVQRPDDSEATVLNRLEVFNQQTAALIAYYKNRGILTRVDSARDRRQTAAEIMRYLKDVKRDS